ncbi:MAG: 2,3-bisphosphoglycerate-independent phosphoglycerate mutase [Candidatus Nanohaloarchaea archaeon]
MRPVLLVVMDGVGLRDSSERNAFKQAETPNLDALMEDGFAELQASGPAVGLPEGYQGNSEVGHLHLGAGRRVPQRLTRINNAIENDELRENTALTQALERAEGNGNAVHFAGIVSDGGIHGHIDHLEALLEIASGYDVDEVYVHAFTDGRDVPPKSAERYLSKVEEWCSEYGAEIATVIGRFYSMDRDKNWGRTHKAYRAMAEAEGFEFESITEPLEATYEQGDYDYFVIPSVKKSYPGMADEDEIIFYNYRADRERQIEELLVGTKELDEELPVHPNFTSMFRYEKDIENPAIFEKKIVEDTLGEKIEDAGLSQLRVAESQKIPHVTYFFNGQRELEFEHETREFIESDKIKAYDQAPEMHADETTKIVLGAVENREHDFVLLNYANGDLVGHTGDLEAAVTAMETVDRNIGKLVDAVENSDYVMLVTADHGNCEDMGQEDDPNTSHTLNPVPLIGVNTEKDFEDGEIWSVENIVGDILGLS